MSDSHKVLYIIGNGFDIHHGLKTSYYHFGLFLKNKYPDTYEILLKYTSLQEIEDTEGENPDTSTWSHLEKKLGEFDFESLLKDYSCYSPDYGSDNFREGDRYQIQQNVISHINHITIELKWALYKFINLIDFPKANKKMIKLNKDALFLTFNYTNTLEHYYKIERKNIEYIHNKAMENDELIVGHGKDSIKLRYWIGKDDWNLAIEKKSSRDLEEHNINPYEWEEGEREMYEPDHSLQMGIDESEWYFEKSFKDTKKIIKQKREFFNGIGKVEKVYILGHSLAEIDFFYFQEVAKKVRHDAYWFVSYHEDDRERKKIFLKELKIDERRISFGKISNLKY